MIEKAKYQFSQYIPPVDTRGRIWLLFAHLNWAAAHGQHNRGKHSRH